MLKQRFHALAELRADDLRCATHAVFCLPIERRPNPHFPDRRACRTLRARMGTLTAKPSALKQARVAKRFVSTSSSCFDAYMLLLPGGCAQ